MNGNKRNRVRKKSSNRPETKNIKVNYTINNKFDSKPNLTPKGTKLSIN